METPKFSGLVEKKEGEMWDIAKKDHTEPVAQKNDVVSLDNPFEDPKYGVVKVPDTPIVGQAGMADSMLNNDEVPEPIKKKFWWVFHKDNTLTFLDDDRKNSKLLNFDIAKIDMLNAMPYYDYTFEKEMEFGILRNTFETKLDRALGFKGEGRKNERIVLQSQFSEQKMIQDTNQSDIKNGFFKRLLGRR